MKTKRLNISFILDVLISVLVLAAWLKMVFSIGDNGTISAGGLKNLKYFTVLSNLLAAAASILNIIYVLKIRKLNDIPGERRGDALTASGACIRPLRLIRLKYAGACATALTFIVVVIFLGPVYRVPGLFSGANLIFHLIVPVLAFISFAADEGPELTVRDSLTAVIPTVVYGTVYAVNIMINGFGDTPYARDLYGILSWGWGIGAMIFAILILVTWGVALILRFIKNRRINGEKNGRQ